MSPNDVYTLKNRLHYLFMKLASSRFMTDEQVALNEQDFFEDMMEFDMIAHGEFSEEGQIAYALLCEEIGLEPIDDINKSEGFLSEKAQQLFCDNRVLH